MSLLTGTRFAGKTSLPLVHTYVHLSLLLAQIFLSARRRKTVSQGGGFTLSCALVPQCQSMAVCGFISCFKAVVLHPTLLCFGTKIQWRLLDDCSSAIKNRTPFLSFLKSSPSRRLEKNNSQFAVYFWLMLDLGCCYWAL